MFPQERNVDLFFVREGQQRLNLALKHILGYVFSHLKSSNQLLLKDLDSFVIPPPLSNLVLLLTVAFPNFGLS